ncbi:MAG: RNA methyltransferase [Candidatus Bathyarchaeota archaeon]|nr:RNA methyltransferase [Candidatus Bathyarchaeota archaeon]
MSVGSLRVVPLKRGCEFSIAIPASLVSDVPHLREKTFKVGLIGRAAAIFRVDEIIIFPDVLDTDQSRDIELVTTILSYIETPQYLRKRLFKIRPELRYAGVLPPLRTPHHQLSDRTENLEVGEHREGVVTSLVKGGSLVDIGVERPVLILDKRLQINNRVTVRVTELGKHPKAVLASRGEIKTYWGYRVTASDAPFGQLLKDQPFDLVIATSRRGAPLIEVMDELAKRWKSSRRTLVAFGAPTQGLYEIATRERLSLDEIVHFVINTIPSQGTETVRTEEALFTSLTALNLLDGE